MAFGCGFSLPSFYGAASGLGMFASASLYLDFTSGNQTLDPRITFSRASNATVVGKDGTIQMAPHNLLTYSEQFDNAAWTKTRATVTANAVVAPDGAVTADKLVEDSTATSSHIVQQTFTLADSTTNAISIYAKKAERSWFRLQVVNKANTTCHAFFNVDTGVVGTTESATASINSIGNGWYRCTIVFASQTGATTPGLTIGLATADNELTYTGNGSSGLYIWGAQLNVGALQPYYPTTVKNLLGYTQEFDNAAWTKSNSSIGGTKVTAPDGTLSAQKLVENVATSTHGLTVNPATINGTSYTFSIFAKKGERNLLRVGMAELSKYGVFDLNTGTVQYVDTGITASITDVGNGWYRCSTIQTANITGNPSFIYRIQSSTTEWPGSGTYTGDGTSGIFIWGAQLSDSASLDPYVYNPGASPAEGAYYGPRFDYDPETLRPKGLLIEEQRTNLVLQSSNFTATAPWIPSNLASIVESVITEYSSGSGQVYLFQPTTITTGLTYTGYFDVQYISCRYVQLLFGAGGFSTGNWVNFDLLNGVVGTKGDLNPTVSMEKIGLNKWRLRMTATATTSASNVNYGIYHVDANDSPRAPDRTMSGKQTKLLRAQLEVGAFPTSYIPTTDAQATRAADNATMIGANFSNWYRQDEGTLFVDSSTNRRYAGTNAFPRAASISDGTSNNRLEITYGVLSAYTDNRSALIANGSVLIDAGSNKQTNGAMRTATAFSSSSSATYDSLSYSITGSGAPSGLPATKMNIGSDGAGGALINGYIRRLGYYNRRLLDSELKALTS